MSQALHELIQDIRKNKSDLLHVVEEEVKQVVIRPVFSYLGWNIFGMGNNREVIPEYSVENRRVDFALIPPENTSNMVFVEVKKPSERLDNNNYQKQLLEYAFIRGVNLAVLTNGFTWQFYLPLNTGDWKTRRFYTVDFLEQEESDIIMVLTDILSKQHIASGQAFITAQKMHDKSRVDKIVIESLPEAWEKLLGGPDEFLVVLLNDTLEKLCGYKADESHITDFLKETISGSSTDKTVISRPVPVTPPTGPNPRPPIPSPNPQVRIQRLNNLDSLAHTSIREGIICGQSEKFWNILLRKGLSIALRRNIDWHLIKQKIPILNITPQAVTDRGMMPIEGTRFSVQNEDAQNSAEALILLATDVLNCRLYVEFYWREKGEHPGQTGIIDFTPRT